MHECVTARQDFAVESTLAGRSYVALIRDWRGIGYRVKIVYLWLDSVELAIERVRKRVAEGGHNVPENIIRRRFVQGWENFTKLYRPLVDECQIYDCCGQRPVLSDDGRE